MEQGNFDIYSILSKPVISDVFKQILRFRVLSHADLEKGSIDENQLNEALEELISKGLINKKSTGFKELDKYFPTREGLEAEKIIK